MATLPGTNRNEELYAQLRSARQIRASGKSRGHERGRALGRNAQRRPRVDDNVAATFGFLRLMNVLSQLLPGAKP